MSDSQKEESYPSTEYMDRLRKAAIFYLVGGLILAALRFVAGKLVFTLVAGGAICAVGFGWLMANNPSNKKTGMLLTGVGILVILSGIRVSILPVVTGVVLSILTMGSLVLGIKNLVMYFIAQNKRY